MAEVNITLLQSNPQKYLAKAYKGSEVLVTLHGAVIAKFTVPTESKSFKTINKRLDLFDLVSPTNGH